MTTCDQIFTIFLSGGTPWGFRLVGGLTAPLVVSKVRKRGKAELAGLQEGDVLLSLNDRNLEGSSHADAISAMDSAGDSISLTCRRNRDTMELPEVMQTSIVSEDGLLRSVENAYQTSAARPMSDYNYSRVSPRDQLNTNDKRLAEENKRAMRERYAISNVYADSLKPITFEGSLKVRSEENLRPTSEIMPMYNSMVTAQLNSNTMNKENTIPTVVNNERKRQISEFADSGIGSTIKTSKGSISSRSMNEGLNTTNDSQEKTHIFGPPVVIGLKAKERDTISVSDPSLHSQKKLFSDSAFYDDAEHSYPTIQDQMKLCQKISQSLTSSANQKARGARMFAKRQKRSPFWVHDGQTSVPSSEISSDYNHGPKIDARDSGVNVTRYRSESPHLQFRIPKLAQRVTPSEVNTQMSLSKSEFENLRLNKQRCEHNAISPVTCFNIAADLQNSKGRAAEIFEKRKQHADAWVVHDDNVKKTNTLPENKLEKMIHINNQYKTNNPQSSYLPPSPEATQGSYMSNRSQNVYPQPPAHIPRIADLTSSKKPNILEGPKFNRVAKGWTPSARTIDDMIISNRMLSQNTPPPPAPKPRRLPDFRQPEFMSHANPTQLQPDTYNTFPRRTRVNQEIWMRSPYQTNYHSYPTDFMCIGEDF